MATRLDMVNMNMQVQKVVEAKGRNRPATPIYLD